MAPSHYSIGCCSDGDNNSSGSFYCRRQIQKATSCIAGKTSNDLPPHWTVSDWWCLRPEKSQISWYWLSRTINASNPQFWLLEQSTYFGSSVKGYVLFLFFRQFSHTHACVPSGGYFCKCYLCDFDNKGSICNKLGLSENPQSNFIDFDNELFDCSPNWKTPSLKHGALSRRRCCVWPGLV